VISLLAVAWSASPAGPFAALGPPGVIDPALETSMGLALLAVAAAVLIRLGAIPAHIWAARFSEAMPASAVPPVLGWGAAAFTLVALGWVDVTISTTGATLAPEHAVIAFAAAASIVLGGVAAILHDDIEHVLAYSIVQDAGVALLAFGATSGTASDAGRTWIVAAVAVKSGLAAWALVTRSTFGVHRRLDLAGWARRSPILGATLAIVLLAAVGLPGMANFDARGTLIRLAMPDPIGVLVLVAALAPLVYLGRLLLTGIDAMTETIRLAVQAVPRLRPERDGGWALDASPIRAAPAAIRANRLPLAAAAALLVAVVGLAVATGGLGSTQAGGLPFGGQPAPSGEQPAPSSSGIAD
jgi:formate hydrogenlyase subunit 3/multisubunit Na+/H+ antiporter MnhD subunit